MRMRITQWGSPKGIGYVLERGWGELDEKMFRFGEDVAENREDATEELPFAGDVIQQAIDEHGITNPINIPTGFDEILSDIQIPEHVFTPPKGRPVWFPVENGIADTDPWSTSADPAMGYVKSLDADGVVEIDVRQVYKRTEASNVADESRKMEPLTGTVQVSGKYCFEKRMDCMDYIIAAKNAHEPVFRAEVEAMPSLQDALDALDSEAAMQM